MILGKTIAQGQQILSLALGSVFAYLFFFQISWSSIEIALRCQKSCAYPGLLQSSTQMEYPRSFLWIPWYPSTLYPPPKKKTIIPWVNVSIICQSIQKRVVL